MIVVVHYTIGVAEPDIAINDMGQHGEKLRSVAVVHHDVLPSIAATGDVIDGPGKLNAKWTGHAARV
ncbi:MAG: hypothetical protein ND866_08820 [Pyrinomonadaceae bacterium]|nr:hypothetical protein [Pyrinomonadaceae bacterium]